LTLNPPSLQSDDTRQQGKAPSTHVASYCLEDASSIDENYSYLIANLPGSQAVIVDPAWQIEKIDQALRDSQARLTAF